MIDFAAINQDAMLSLRSLLSVWLPDGKYEGVQYVAQNPRRKDNTAGSFKVNTQTGIWNDFACQGVKGSDPISLCAYLFHNDNQGDAAKDLSGDAFKVRDLPKQPQKKYTQWKTIVPVPKTAPQPPTEYPKKIDNKWVRVPIKTYYKYYTKDAEFTGYTVRIEYENGNKDVLPLTYCESDDGKKSWRFRGFPVPRPIYGQEDLYTNKEAQVLVVEGEKCRDAAKKIFAGLKNLVVISWCGGIEGAAYVNWTPLNNRKLLFWPDADKQNYPEGHENSGETMPFIEQPGTTVMYKIFGIVSHKITGARFVMPPKTVPAKWDIADAIYTDKWDAKKILGYIKGNLHEMSELSLKPQQIMESGAVNTPFHCLGYNSTNGTMMYYYLPVGTHKVICLSAQGHSKMCLISLANITYWEREYPQKSGADYFTAANDLMRSCESRGIYDPQRIRGRGAWYDNKRPVLHLGDRLIVGQNELKIDEIKSKYIYEAEIPIEESKESFDNPLLVEESKKLLSICRLLPFEDNDGMYSRFLAGWVFLSPICGALEWRPHIWLTGESGCGKSWTINNIILPAVEKYAINASSDTTEAGLRQWLGNDAFSVIFDEIETENGEDFNRVQRILQLARQASSNQSANIIKGTMGGKAMAFCIRSCFMFSSINPKLIKQSDSSRVTVLGMSKKAAALNETNFRDIKKLVLNTINHDWCVRLRARAIKMIPKVRENFRIHADVMSIELSDKRMGDQYGALMAGAYCLGHDDIVDRDLLSEQVKKIDWSMGKFYEKKTDQEDCFSVIVQQLIPYKGGPMRETVGKLMRDAGATIRNTSPTEHDTMEVKRREANRSLKNYGLSVVHNKDGKYEIAISSNHQQLNKLLKDTTYNNGYQHVLGRIEGTYRKTVSFGDGLKSNAIIIPYDAVFSCDVESNEPEYF